MVAIGERRDQGAARLRPPDVRALRRRHGRPGQELLQRPGLPVRLREGGQGDPGPLPRRQQAGRRGAGAARAARGGNLVGPESYVKERIAAFREAGVTNLQLIAGRPRTRPRPSRRSRSGSPDARHAVDLRPRSTRTSAHRPRPSSRRRSSPTTTSGRRTARSAARSGPRPARRGCSASTSTRSTAAPGSRTSATTWCVAEEISRVGRQRPRLPGAHRHHRPLPQRASGTDEQKQRWLPGLRQRRADLRDRDDRARRRQRPAGHPHHRGRQGRPLRAQRLQDLHQQRHPVRPGDRGRAHRPRGRPQGHQPARRRARHGRLRARPQPREGRPARRRTPPSCSSTTSRCRRRTCSARRAPASSR